MSAGSQAGAGAGAGIPANARRVVQDLKEIVKNSDDEIYAMLKECHMDPNETVQRLLNQDTFHEVKRKRDKNKVSANKESVETRPRASGASSPVQGAKAPDRGNGWGCQNPRYNSELSGGRRRVQSFSGRDNGISQNVKAQSITTPALPLLSQAKTPMGSSTSNTIGTIISDSIVVSNGTASHTNTPQVACGGGWSTSSGHADVIESTTLQKYATAAPLSSSNTSSVPQLTSSSSSLPPAVYTSSTDSILHSTSEPSTTGLVPSKPDAPVISSSVPESLEALYQTVQTSIDDLSSFSLEAKVKTTDVDATSTSVKAFSEYLTASELQSLEIDSSFETLCLSPSATKTMHAGDEYNDRVVYQAPQQPVRSQKGPGPEWKPKSPMRTVTPQAYVAITTLSPPASPQASMGILSDPTSKVHRISMQDDQHVIIPNHLQVPEAEQTHLNFGSFRDDFSTPISINLATSEEDNRNSAPIEDNLPGLEPPTEHFIASSLTTSAPASLDQNYSSQSTVPLKEAFVGSDNVSVRLPAEVISPVMSTPEELNTAPVFQQSSQYPYLSAGIPNYTSFGIMPQLMGARYNQEVAESQQQDLSHLPHFMLPLADLGTSYYSPLLRPTAEVEAARYSHFISTNAAAKLNPGATLPTGQGVSSSQEGGGGRSVSIPTTGPTTQAVGIPQTGHTILQTGHTVLQIGHTIPQQPVSVQAYPAQHAGIPLAPLGANFVGLQYVAPNYGYFPSSYQHSFATNTGYPQAHSVNNFASVGSSPYVATGTATMKYALPQHKPGAAASSTPHALAAAGYGNFSSPVGVATVSDATTTTAFGYDTGSGTPFKENSIYIPNQQQGEGSTVWVQTPLSRDVTGIQNNSFYTLLGQGHLTGYAHTQPTHAVPATMAAHTNLYHPSQSSMPPTVHQLLQESQPGGGVVGGTGRIGVYQQAQHGQLNWTNKY